MKRGKVHSRGVALLLLSIGFLILLIQVSFAQTYPLGPDTVANTGKGRHQNGSNPVQIQAFAGNVSALVISAVRSTAAWQGYYGNVTGTITLDDANNQTLYDWSLPNPTGEVYASNYSSVDWTRIYCMNLSYYRPHCASGICYSTNSTMIELEYGINDTDKDGLNETFSSYYTDPTGFSVGPTTIDVTDGCSMTNPYTDEVAGAWQELLLSDNQSIVFTSIIRENADAFQLGTEQADFEMLVLENGHVGYETTTTNYYFFVELS